MYNFICNIMVYEIKNLIETIYIVCKCVNIVVLIRVPSICSVVVTKRASIIVTL